MKITLDREKFHHAFQTAASPTLVGAITTLIVILAVFLAYNANNGLPFVPELPGLRRGAERGDAAQGQ